MGGIVAVVVADARRAVLAKAGLDDRQLMPAWQRYEGMLYSAAGRALQGAIEAGLHVLIISGGYGVIKACEPIGSRVCGRSYRRPQTTAGW